MPLSRVILSACLTVFQALLWLTAGLCLALTVVQALRGDVDRQPAMTLGLGAGMAAAGLACRMIRRRVDAGS